MTIYHLDSIGGNDATGDGTLAHPWATPTPVNAMQLQPGDEVVYRRGRTHPGGLVINGSGTAHAPIVVHAYGDEDRPLLANAAYDATTVGIHVDGKRYIQIRDLQFRDIGTAIRAEPLSGAHHLTVENCVCAECGVFADLYADDSVMRRCYAHDLRMVVNTVGGNEDYGANGVIVSGDRCLIEDCRFVNCVAPSEDWGTDGGAIEVWRGTTDLIVRRCYAENCDVFSEIGGMPGDSVNNLLYERCVIVDCDPILTVHQATGGDTYGVTIGPDGIRMEQCSCYQPEEGQSVVWSNAEIMGDMLQVRNCVFGNWQRLGLNWTPWANFDGFTHEHNCYDPISGHPNLGAGEVEADPEYINVADGYLRIGEDSPCIGAGMNLGYATDIRGRLYGDPPTMGAHAAPRDPGGRKAAHNVNVSTSNWHATGQSVSVPQYEMTLHVDWMAPDGAPRTWQNTVTFPNDLQHVPNTWLKDALFDLMLRAARKRLGVDR